MARSPRLSIASGTPSARSSQLPSSEAWITSTWGRDQKSCISRLIPFSLRNDAGAAAGTTVSHVSDIVGPSGCVYAVEFSHRPGRDLINMAQSRTNVIPIIEDARHPLKYRMLVPMVDCVFADVAQSDQARIVGINAQHFLRQGGHFVISIKASCIDSTAKPENVFAAEVEKLKGEKLKPKEQLTLEPYERAHAVVVGVYRPLPKG
eukprot:scaffold7513_cov296-Pinguiococcus_pyrenoidosus.AAC.2